MAKPHKQPTPAEAVEILGVVLSRTDTLTREMVQVLLKNLCEHPDQAERYGQVLEKTLAIQPALDEKSKRSATVLSLADHRQ